MQSLEYIYYEIRELKGLRHYYILTLYGRDALKNRDKLEDLGFIYDKVSNSFSKVFTTKRKIELILKELNIDYKETRDKIVDEAITKLQYYYNSVVGKFCYGEKEDLFLLLKNFRYSVNFKCFYYIPTARYPDIVLMKSIKKKLSLTDFIKETNAKISLNGEKVVPLNVVIPLYKNLQVYFLTLEQSISLLGKLNSFQVRQLLARVNNLFPVCSMNNFDEKERRCKKLEALIIFS